MELSISSLRADSLTEDLAASLARGGHRTLTIAPEAGTERLRRAIRKAITAASGRVPTGGADQEHAVKLAFTTGGRLTNLKAGVPIVVGEEVVGAVGVSSGTGDQDLEVALAGIGALSDAKQW